LPASFDGPKPGQMRPPQAAGASTLSTTLTKIPGKVRSTRRFRLRLSACSVSGATTRTPARRATSSSASSARTRPAGAPSTPTRPGCTPNLKGSDITRIYNWEFRGYKYYGGRIKNRYHGVQVTLVDNFASTRTPRARATSGPTTAHRPSSLGLTPGHGRSCVKRGNVGLG
jgi:hypothetical protein